MECHLHIGAHRTGTTAMQKLLQGHSGLLAAAGVAFRGPSALRRSGLFDVIQRALHGQVPPKRHQAMRRLLQDWLDEARPASRIILSDENLSGTMLKNHVSGLLYPDAAARLAAFGALLPVQPDVVHVTIRDFVGYWQSVAAHLASRGKLVSFDAERLSQGAGPSWLPFLQGVRSAFPAASLRVMRYDDTVVSRLARALVGDEVGALLPAPWRSLSLALDDVATARIEALAPGPAREALAQTLRLHRDPPERVFLPDEARDLHAAYAADWQALRAGAVAGAWLDPVALAMDPVP